MSGNVGLLISTVSKHDLSQVAPTYSMELICTGVECGIVPFSGGMVECREFVASLVSVVRVFRGWNRLEAAPRFETRLFRGNVRSFWLSNLFVD